MKPIHLRDIPCGAGARWQSKTLSSVGEGDSRLSCRACLRILANRRAGQGPSPGRAPLRRTVHFFGKVDERGRVSPACAGNPRALNEKRATWTLSREYVTCPLCLALPAAAFEPDSGDPIDERTLGEWWQEVQDLAARQAERAEK